MAIPDSNTPKKPCSKCGEEYPRTVEFFAPDSRRKDGLRSECRNCKKKDDQRYRTDNREVVNQRSLNWYHRNAESRIAYSRNWQQENSRRVSDKSRRWRLANPRKWEETQQRWRFKNPEKVLTKNRNRIARQRAAEGTHTAEDIQRQYERQKGRCFYCQCELTDTPRLPNSRTVDHVIPISRGGRNSPDNLVIACSFCNSSKGDKLPHEWNEGEI